MKKLLKTGSALLVSAGMISSMSPAFANFAQAEENESEVEAVTTSVSDDSVTTVDSSDDSTDDSANVSDNGKKKHGHRLPKSLRDRMNGHRPGSESSNSGSDDSSSTSGSSSSEQTVKSGRLMGKISSLSVNSDGSGSFTLETKANNAAKATSVKVEFDSEAKITRRHGAEIEASELSEGDRVMLKGKLSNGVFSASVVIDMSLVMVGGEYSKHTTTITALDIANNTMTVSVVNEKGETKIATVTYVDATEIKKGDTKVDENSLAVGQTVKINGIAHLEENNATITQVKEIEIK